MISSPSPPFTADVRLHSTAPPVANAYAVAIAVTEDMIQRRANRHRWLVVTVVAVVLLTPAGAIAWRSWRPLAAWALLIPCCAAALTLDAALLARWRRDILDAWAAGDLNLDAFRAAVTTNRVLPPGTLAGMLATLPDGAAAALASAERRATASALRARDARGTFRSALTTTLLALAAGAVIVAAGRA